MKKTVVILMMVVVAMVAVGQKRVQKAVKDVEGVGYADCIGEAYKQASQAAREEAYRAGGGFDNIHSTFVGMQSAGGESSYAHDTYSALNIIRLDALVTDVKEKEVSYSIKDNKLVQCKVTIDAKVRQGEAEDKTFTFVFGKDIEPTYSHRSIVSFSVIPNQDSYLRVVFFNGEVGKATECIVVYPDTTTNSGEMKKGVATEVRFGVENNYSDGRIDHGTILVTIHKKDVGLPAAPWKEFPLEKYWKWYDDKTTPSNVYMEYMPINILPAAAKKGR